MFFYFFLQFSLLNIVFQVFCEISNIRPNTHLRLTLSLYFLNDISSEVVSSVSWCKSVSISYIDKNIGEIVPERVIGFLVHFVYFFSLSLEITPNEGLVFLLYYIHMFKIFKI